MRTFQFAKPTNDAPITQVIQVARNMSFVSNLSHILSVALPGSWLVLGFLGWLLNSYEQKQKVREQELYQLKSHLQQQLIEGQRECGINLTKSMREIEQALQKDLLTRIQCEQQSREQSLQSLQEARKLNASEAQARLQPLKTALARLKQLQVEIEIIASSLVIETRESGDQAGTGNPPDQTRPTPDGKNNSHNSDRGSWADE